MLTCPASLALAVSMNRVTAIRVVTVTATGTAFTKLPVLREGAEKRSGQSAGGHHALPSPTQAALTGQGSWQ